MNEQPNLQQFVDHLSSYSEDTPQPGVAVPSLVESIDLNPERGNSRSAQPARG